MADLTKKQQQPDMNTQPKGASITLAKCLSKSQVLRGSLEHQQAGGYVDYGRMATRKSKHCRLDNTQICRDQHQDQY